jgi:signal transduction histidine kinase
VEVQTAAPVDAFHLPLQRIANLLAEDAAATMHRVHVTGSVTYHMGSTFFLQDGSGGIRVHSDEPLAINVGDAVEVVAFPARDGFVRLLARAQVRRVARTETVQPREWDMTEALSARQNGSLVRVDATLLTQKTNDGQLVLELQKQSRVFVATLATDLGSLPEFKPGSQLRIVGVCDDDNGGTTATDEKTLRNPSLAALHLLLRTPADVIVLRGPPWWTWQRTALLVGALVLVLVVALSWVHLLRRRLERQQAAQLAFSRQVLKRLEDDRRRIAVNLHDSLGQILLLIKNHALLALQPPPDETDARQRLNEISAATSNAIEEVREITHDLRPYQLDRLGLTQAIRTSVQQAAVNNTISFACRVEDVDGSFDQDTEIHVYRIVQEAVTNVVKHAAATEATVVVKRRPDTVSLSIRDNGRGFEAAQLAARPQELGYGLTGIGERARILGATLEINSQPGGGTSLTVEIPLPGRKL